MSKSEIDDTAKIVAATRQSDDEAEQSDQNVYLGMEVKLSTKGKYGAPAAFHCRSFDTKDLMNLAIVKQEELPVQLINVLQSMIEEPKIKIAKFLEPEVKELLVKNCCEYITHHLEGFPYTPSEADLKWLLHNEYSDNEEDEQYQALLRKLDKGDTPYKINLDLDQLVPYEVTELNEIKVLTAKKGDFVAKFRLPLYGDVLDLTSYVNAVFANEDKMYAKAMDVLSYRQNCKDQISQGVGIAYGSLPSLTAEQEKEVYDYQRRKTALIIQASIAQTLVEVNGEDVSQCLLATRIEKAKDPHFTHAFLSSVSEAFSKLPIGLKPEVIMTNPVTGKKDDTLYLSQFQVITLIQMMRDAKPEGMEISFEQK